MTIINTDNFVPLDIKWACLTRFDSSLMGRIVQRHHCGGITISRKWYWRALYQFLVFLKFFPRVLIVRELEHRPDIIIAKPTMKPIIKLSD